jgi:hypothetical protein
MADNRTQQWREAKRKAGLKAVTVWLTTEQEGRLKDLALTWHCSPSELMQHALAQFHPGCPPRLSDDTDMSQTSIGHDTDVSQIQAWLQAELPGMVRKIVEQLAVDMFIAEPGYSDVPDAEQIQNSSVAEITPIRNGNVSEMATPTYDADRYYLGKLCPRGHAYEGTGKSLLRRHNQSCRQCENERKHQRRAQQAQ